MPIRIGEMAFTGSLSNRLRHREVHRREVTQPIIVPGTSIDDSFERRNRLFVTHTEDFWPHDVENSKSVPSQVRAASKAAVTGGEHHGQVPVAQALPRRTGIAE
jgi:hypothetical protein